MAEELHWRKTYNPETKQVELAPPPKMFTLVLATKDGWEKVVQIPAGKEEQPPEEYQYHLSRYTLTAEIRCMACQRYNTVNQQPSPAHRTFKRVESYDTDFYRYEEQ